MPEIRSAPAINPQYPTSWWGIGFSHEIRAGEVVPVKLLERDVILWRDAAGDLHCHSAICPHLGANIGYGGRVVGDAVRCPFHGYRYDSSGQLCARVGEKTSASERVHLARYPVREHFGTVFVWNGSGEPDHDFPLADMLPAGVEREEDTSAFRCAFQLPFPAKWFAENVADANHLAVLHQAADWGDVELVDQTPTLLVQRMTLANPAKPYSAAFWRSAWAVGQLRNPPVASENGITESTYGGGIHLTVIDPPEDTSGEHGVLDRIRRSAQAVRAVTCFTPITANSSWHSQTIIVPRIRGPIPRRAVALLANHALASRDWAAGLQDAAVMIHRQEPSRPAYGRLDAGLIRFRRFWDSRIEDRSLWAGDGIHSNGLRAGIRWHDAPSLPTENVPEVAR